MGKQSIFNPLRRKTLFLANTSTILMICVSVLLLPILAILFIISKISHAIVKLQYGRQISKPGTMDTFVGIGKSNALCVITSVRFTGRLAFHQFKDTLIKKLQLDIFPIHERRLRRFQQVCVDMCGYMYFLNYDNFNIDKHIIEVTKEDLEGINDEDSKQSVIDSLIKENYDYDDWQGITDKMLKFCGNKIIDPKIPQWQIFFYQEKNTFNMVIRFSHIIIDGINFMRFFVEEFGDKPLQQVLPYKYNKPSTTESIFMTILAYLLLPLAVKKITTNPGYGPLLGPKLSSVKRFALSRAVPVDDIYEIKKKCQTPFNTVMISCAAYALTCHYRKKKSKVANTLFTVPISMQDTTEEIKTMNKFGIHIISLTTDRSKCEHDSALKRLAKTESDILASTEDLSYVPLQMLFKFMYSLLPECINEKLLNKHGAAFIYSNMPGPLHESIQVLGGNYSKDFAFWINTMQRLGMGLTVMTHLKQARIGLSIDKTLMKTDEETYEFLENFIAEIYNLRRELNMESKNGSAIKNK